MSGFDGCDEGFRAEMSDVQPIRTSRRVALSRTENSRLNVVARRKAALEEASDDRNELSGEYVEPLDPNAFLEFKRPGIQNGVYRNLRLGKYAVDARLDLHHHTVEQARVALYGFVRDCLQHDIRCALITHGKGEGRQQPALIKSCVAHWLPQFNEVLAFHSSQKHHGGTGATYVLLRKSERKRQDNLERHQKRKL